MKSARIAAANKCVNNTKARTNKRNPNKHIIRLKDLSTVEGATHGITELQSLAETASTRAAEDAMRIGLPKVYATGKEVVKENGDGTKMILDQIRVKAAQAGYYVKYKKGTVLHTRSK